jgi:hypothetical protein
MSTRKAKKVAPKTPAKKRVPKMVPIQRGLSPEMVARWLGVDRMPPPPSSAFDLPPPEVKRPTVQDTIDGLDYALSEVVSSIDALSVRIQPVSVSINDSAASAPSETAPPISEIEARVNMLTNRAMAAREQLRVMIAQLRI